MVGQRIGYARVSTLEQNPERQEVALAEAKVGRVFIDKASGRDTHRPELENVLKYTLNSGDTLVVPSLDRLGRSLIDVCGLVERLTEEGVTVEFLAERLTFKPGADDPFAKLQLQMLGAFAEFERNMNRRRQAEGIALARAAGKYKGRGRALTPDQIEEARRLLSEGVPKAKVARHLGVSRQTLYSALSGEGVYSEEAQPLKVAALH